MIDVCLCVTESRAREPIKSFDQLMQSEEARKEKGARTGHGSIIVWRYSYDAASARTRSIPNANGIPRAPFSRTAYSASLCTRVFHTHFATRRRLHPFVIRTSRRLQQYLVTSSQLTAIRVITESNLNIYTECLKDARGIGQSLIKRIYSTGSRRSYGTRWSDVAQFRPKSENRQLLFVTQICKVKISFF